MAIIRVTKIKGTTPENAQRIVTKVRRLKVLVTPVVSQDKMLAQAEDGEVHVEVKDEKNQNSQHSQVEHL